MSRYSFSSGRFASHPSPAAEEMKPIADPRGSMPWARSRSMRYRWPMKLIFSMPGVPSATPAHVDPRRPLRHRRLLVVLHRCGDELERDAGRGLALLHVAVRHGLRVGGRLERVLDDGPLAPEVGEPLAPLLERLHRERLGED